jgi:type II secretory pathway component PulF
MIRKVILTNTNTGKSTEVFVDAASDEKAVLGSGKAPNESAKVVALAGLDEWLQRKTGKKPTLEERTTLFAGLARCLERNISTIKSLQLMAGRMQSPRYRGALADISADIAAGDKMSDAMANHPDLFSEETLALVRAGEESGRLPEVFHQIANSQKKTVRILKKLKAGMIYPAIVLVMAVGVVIIMSFTLIPAISKLYASMNVSLPWATTILIGLSNILLKQPWLAAIPVVGLYYLFKKWGKIYGIPGVQRAFIHMPTVGQLIRKSAATVSFRCLATLLQANVRIMSALEITAAGSPHVDFREFFLRVRNHVADGTSMPEAFLMESHWLGEDGRTIAAMVQIAGETGSANEMLDELATDYEDELDTMANQIDKIIEPFTIVTMGTLVGFLIYAIYGPIFNLSQVVLPKRSGPPPAGQSVPR